LLEGLDNDFVIVNVISCCVVVICAGYVRDITDNRCFDLLERRLFGGER
jgi:hypothetical protein